MTKKPLESKIDKIVENLTEYSEREILYKFRLNWPSGEVIRETKSYNLSVNSFVLQAAALMLRVRITISNEIFMLQKVEAKVSWDTTVY